jgi:YD repeat-containing protein
VTAFDVKAKADSLKPAIKLKNPNLKFGNVPTGGNVPSRDTFTLRKTEATAFNPADLRWQFDQKFAPIANAGPDQSVTAGSTVYLDGSDSGNDDEDEDEDEPLGYQWSFVSKPTGSTATLSNATLVNPTFIVDKTGTYTLQLVVTQEDRASQPDTVVITTNNSPPVANAGADQSVSVGTAAVLDGTGSSDADNNPLTFKWTITNKPATSTATLLNSTAVNPSFTIDKAGTYSIQLIVNDGQADSEATIVLVTTLNARPVAQAGDDQGGHVNDLITLDGSASSDVDGDALTYTWSLMAKPAGSAAALNDPTAVKPTFTIDKPGVYVAQLIVHDALTDSDPDTVIITTENSKPVANPGLDQTVALNALVHLDGAASSDPDNDPLTYQWSFVSKPATSTATLSNPTSANPSFTANKPGNYVLELIVNDGIVDSLPKTVTISTLNSRPVADAGLDQTASQSLILLDGSASGDADNDPLGYQWSLLSKPANSQASLDNPIAIQPGFTADFPGYYVGQLIVNDGKLDSDPDTVTVEVPSTLFNHPPVITTEAPIMAQAGQPYSYAAQASDPDLGDFLDYAFTTAPSGMTINPSTGLILWTPTLAQVGQHDITLEAKDSYGATATQSYTLTVTSTVPVSTIPNIIGQTRAEAVAALIANNLNVGTVTFEHSATVTSGHVIQATPSANTVVEQGIGVNLVISLGADVGLPPDPAVVAPDPAPTPSFTPLNQTAEFLYTGLNPIQTGVAPGTIEAKRIAVIRGKVLTRDSQPLSGVTVTIKDHPEYGRTLSRTDGQYDLAVNGGGYLTLNYQKAGFLPAQRQANTPWQDYVNAEDIALIPLDSQVTAIDLAATMPQAAQGSQSTYIDGQRQATVLFPVGTQATMTLPNGSTQALTSLNVRATEYTVGPNGPKAMPGALPPSSGYTYAVELSVDEALAAGASKVTFNQPLPVYVDNFLGFPVGENVPAGWYDSQKSAWIPSNNGKVIKILSINSGVADLDTNGDNLADNAGQLAALGITSSEQAQLGTLYAVGKTLWRVPVTHFTPWDFNWPWGLPSGATPPPSKEPKLATQDNPDSCQGNTQKGCVIEAQNQTLGEDLDIVATPHSIHFRSDRLPGNKSGNTLNIPLSAATVPATLKRIDLIVSVAGREFKQGFIPAPNLSHTFTWDGKNTYGQPVQGRQTAHIRVGYVYGAVYFRSSTAFTASFGAPSNSSGGGGAGGLAIVASRPNLEITQWKDWEKQIGSFQNKVSGLGGWSLNVHHVYDPGGRELYLGDGSHRLADSFGAVITTLAGNGTTGFSGDNGPATQALLNHPTDIALGAEGSLYIADNVNFRIRRIRPDGIISTVAGVGGSGSDTGAAPGDGGPATQASLHGPQGIAIAADGSLYITELTRHRIRKVSPDGIISTVAGNGTQGFSGDGGPATQASLYYPYGIVVGEDGSLYFSDSNNHRVRRVGPDGIITTVAGKGAPGFSGDGGPATQASFHSPLGIALGADGSLYISDYNNHRLRRVSPDGIITTVVGNGTQGFSGDGGLATQSSINFPRDIEVGTDGSLYFSDSSNHRIRRVSPDGIVTTVAGNGVGGSGGDGGQATQASLYFPYGVVVGKEGGLFISGYFSHRIRRVSPLFPSFSTGDLAIPSQDGSEVYKFDGSGRHTETRSTLTNAVLYRFAYDAKGLLKSATDVDGDITSIERDGVGKPTAIIAPDGQRTNLGLDANGYLAQVTNPANESHNMSYTANGLLTRFTTPEGHANSYEYDSLGRLTKDTDPVLGGWTLNRTEQTVGFTTTMTSGEGRTSQYQVEPLSTGDRRQVNTHPDGTVQTTLYKANGEQTKTSADGVINTLLQSPDPRFGMQAPIAGSTSVKLPSGLTSNATNTRTAPLGNANDLFSLISLTDTSTVNGKAYTSVFNKAALTRTQTSPVGRTIVTQLNSKGRPVQTTVANIAPVNYQYDARGRLIQLDQGTTPDNRTSQISYNAQGYADTVTDAISRTTAFEYDLAGRITRQVLPDNREIAYSYDQNGNLQSLTPPGRPPHVYSHTPVDLTQDYTPPTVDINNPQTVYQYNKDKQLTKITRPDLQELAFTYGQASGKLTTLTLPTGTYSYQYAPSTGKLSTITAPDNGQLAYTYDGSLLKDTTWTGTISGSVNRTYNVDFNVTELKVNGLSPIAFQYDNDQLLTQAGSLILTRNAQNGMLTGTALGSLTDSYSYNGFGETSQYAAKYATNEFFKAVFTRDKLGRIAQKVETVNGTAHTYDYAYDSAGRLIEEKRRPRTKHLRLRPQRQPHRP